MFLHLTSESNLFRILTYKHTLMIRYLFLFLPVLLFACQPDHEVKQKTAITEEADIKKFALYSAAVSDSFTISVYMPDTLIAEKPDRFPVIYVLDANLYFDIYASILKKYSEVGLLSPAILVGIGYSSFQKMDSLRQRDYTFPEGLPEYEMPVSGKADLFLDFVQKELIPVIDQKFRSDTSKRIIMGHSLGGYFIMYALLKELKEHKGLFMGYIAASPSLHYNHNYLLKQFDSIGNFTGNGKKCYAVYGGLENPELKTTTTLTIDSLFKNLSANFSKIAGAKLKTASFSEMDHMDTQIPGFIKGLQWIMAE